MSTFTNFYFILRTDDPQEELEESSDYEYNYDDYYYSPLRRIGESPDYYYYYEDEYYPHQLERQAVSGGLFISFTKINVIRISQATP